MPNLTLRFNLAITRMITVIMETPTSTETMAIICFPLAVTVILIYKGVDGLKEKKKGHKSGAKNDHIPQTQIIQRV